MDVASNSYRKTVYKTLEDPVTHKKVTEVINYLYDKTGAVEPVIPKGQHIDTKA
jgi:hypothetical protein